MKWVERNSVAALPYDLDGIDDAFLDSLDKDTLEYMCNARGLDPGSSWHRDKPLKMLKGFRAQIDEQQELKMRAKERAEDERVQRISALRSQATATTPDMDDETDAHFVALQHAECLQICMSAAGNLSFWYKCRVDSIDVSLEHGTVVVVTWPDGTADTFGLRNLSQSKCRVLNSSFYDRLPIKATQPFAESMTLKRPSFSSQSLRESYMRRMSAQSGKKREQINRFETLRDIYGRNQERSLNSHFRAWKTYFALTKASACILQSLGRKLIARRKFEQRKRISVFMLHRHCKKNDLKYLLDTFALALDVLETLRDNLRCVFQTHAFSVECLVQANIFSELNSIFEPQDVEKREILPHSVSTELLKRATLLAGVAGSVIGTFSNEHLTIKHKFEEMLEQTTTAETLSNRTCSLEVDRQLSFNVPALKPLNAVLYSVVSLPLPSDQAPSPGIDFVVNMLAFVRNPHKVPRVNTWLGEVLENLSRERLQQVKDHTNIVPSRAYTLDEESDVTDNLNSSPNAFGTICAPPGAIGIQSLADNYETAISGKLSHSTTLAERFLVVDNSQPTLLSMLQRPESSIVVPMHDANLEPDVSSWAASLEDDALIEHCVQTMLISAAENHSVISAATHATTGQELLPGVDKRFKHGESGLEPIEYCVVAASGSHSIVKHDLCCMEKNRDGLNVFTRNSIRLLRSKVAQFSRHETLASLLKELSEAANDLNIPSALFSGDGAPCIQISNRQRKAAYTLLCKNATLSNNTGRQRGVLLLPSNFPRTPEEMREFLKMSSADAAAAQTMEQHVHDQSHGSSLVANTQWQNLRAVRFTASSAFAMCGAAVFKCEPQNSEALLQAHEDRIEKNGLNTSKCARSPVLAKIYNNFAGNKYTAYGTDNEETARIVSTCSTNINTDCLNVDYMRSLLKTILLNTRLCKKLFPLFFRTSMVL